MRFVSFVVAQRRVDLAVVREISVRFVRGVSFQLAKNTCCANSQAGSLRHLFHERSLAVGTFKRSDHGAVIQFTAA